MIVVCSQTSLLAVLALFVACGTTGPAATRPAPSAPAPAPSAPAPAPAPSEPAPPPDHALIRLGRSSQFAFPAGTPAALAWSPDGTSLAAGGRVAPGVYVYDVASFTLREVLAPELNASDIAYAPDGQKLALCDEQMAIVDLADPARAVTPITPSGTFAECALQWSRDGKRILLAKRELVAIFDAATGARIADTPTTGLPQDGGELSPPTGRDMFFVAAPPDGTLVAMNGRVRLVFDGTSFSRRPPVLDDVRVLGLARDGAHVLVGNPKGALSERIEVVTLGATPSRVMITAPPENLPRGEFSPDGTRVYLGSDAALRRVGRIADVASGAPIGAAAEVAGVISRAAAWSPDGARLALPFEDRVVLYDARGQGVPGAADATSVEGAIGLVVFDRDGARVGTAAPGAVRVWDRASGATLVRVPTPDAVARTIDLGRDVAVVVTPGDAGVMTSRLTLHDLGHDGAALYTREVPRSTEKTKAGQPAVSIAGDKILLVTNGAVHVYALADGAELGPPTKRVKPLMLAVLDATGAPQIIGGGWDDVRVGPLASADSNPVVSRYIGPIHGASDDGSTLIASVVSNGNVVAVRRLGAPRWTLIAAPRGDTARLPTLSPDARRLAVIGLGRVLVFDAATGAMIAERALGHGRDIKGMALSRDGAVLATGFADGTTTLWSLPPHDATPPAAAPAPAAPGDTKPLAPWLEAMFTEGAPFELELDGTATIYGEGPSREKRLRRKVTCLVNSVGALGARLVSRLRCDLDDAVAFAGWGHLEATYIREDGRTFVLPGVVALDAPTDGGSPFAEVGVDTPVAGETPQRDGARVVTIDPAAASSRDAFCVARRVDKVGSLQRCYSARGLERVEVDFGAGGRLVAVRKK